MLRYFIETYNNLIEKNKDGEYICVSNFSSTSSWRPKTGRFRGSFSVDLSSNTHIILLFPVMKTKVKDANSYDMHYRDSLQPYSIINKKSCEKTEKKLVQDELNRERRTGQKSPYLSVTNPVTVQKLTEKRPSPKNMIEASDSFYDRSGNENRKPIVKPNGPRPSTLSTTPKRNGLLNAPRETSLRNTPQNQGPVKRKFPDDKPDLSCHSSPRNNYLSRSAPVALSPKPKYGGETNSTPVDVYRHRRLVLFFTARHIISQARKHRELLLLQCHNAGTFGITVTRVKLLETSTPRFQRGDQTEVLRIFEREEIQSATRISQDDLHTWDPRRRTRICSFSEYWFTSPTTPTVHRRGNRFR